MTEEKVKKPVPIKLPYTYYIESDMRKILLELGIEDFSFNFNFDKSNYLVKVTSYFTKFELSYTYKYDYNNRRTSRLIERESDYCLTYESMNKFINDMADLFYAAASLLNKTDTREFIDMKKERDHLLDKNNQDYIKPVKPINKYNGN